MCSVRSLTIHLNEWQANESLTMMTTFSYRSLNLDLEFPDSIIVIQGFVHDEDSFDGIRDDKGVVVVTTLSRCLCP